MRCPIKSSTNRTAVRTWRVDPFFRVPADYKHLNTEGFIVSFSIGLFTMLLSFAHSTCRASDAQQMIPTNHRLPFRNGANRGDSSFVAIAIMPHEADCGSIAKLTGFIWSHGGDNVPIMLLKSRSSASARPRLLLVSITWV